MKLPPAFDVVVGELLLDLGEAESVGDQLVGIDADLIFAGGTSEAGNIDDIGDGLEVLLDHPVFDRLQLHHVVLGIRAVQREEVDLADRTPVGAHLRHDPGRQRNLRKPLENSFPVPCVLLLVIENQLQVREPEEGERAQMHDVRDAVHHDFERNRDLLLDLFRGDSRPLRDDLHIVVRHVGIRFDGKLMERNRAPAKQQERRREDKKAVLQRKIDKFANHLLLHRVLKYERILNDLVRRA